MFRRFLGALLAGTAFAAVSISAAQAGAFGSHQQSVPGAGMAFAGVAAPGIGLSGMAWNPALVTDLAGINFESHLLGVIPNTTLTDVNFTATGATAAARAGALAGMNAAGGPGEFGTSLLAPASYGNWQIAPNAYLGVSITSPYGDGTHAQSVWGGSWDFQRTRVNSVNVQPVIGYRLNEQFAFAFGAQIQWIRITQEQSIGPIGPFGATAGATGQVTGEDMGVGFTAGLTWTPVPGTSLGIGYRSGVHHRLDGQQNFFATVVNPLTGLPAIPNGASFNVQASFDTPDQVTLSGRQQITDRFALTGTVEWTNWSRLGVVPINGSPVGSALILNYRDGWLASIGAEYRALDNLTLRAGIGYEWTPVRDEFRSLAVPDADRIWIGTGFTWDFSNRLSVMGSYTYIHLQDASVNRSRAFVLGPPPLTPLVVGFTGTVQSDIHILGIAVRYRFDEPAEPAVVARN